jgi:hypothetical protein
MPGFEQLAGMLAETPGSADGYSGYVLVAIPLKNGKWCPTSGVVTGYISLPSLAVQDADTIGRRI